MALFPLLKTARVASGENSLLMHIFNTYWLYIIASSLKVQRKLADQQSSSRTLENQSTNLNTIQY
jgi:hypothetical protein